MSSDPPVEEAMLSLCYLSALVTKFKVFFCGLCSFLGDPVLILIINDGPQPPDEQPGTHPLYLQHGPFGRGLLPPCVPV